MKKRATIEDVARIAGVSTATVSRTIHTPDVVSDSTREAVFGAIDQTGFTLNQAARNLRQQRANAVLVLVPDIGNTFFSEILAGIERVASSEGQIILIGDTANDAVREAKFLDTLVNGQADGALLLNGHLPKSVTERIKRSQDRVAPIVSVSEALDSQIVPHVGIDNKKAAATATQHLIAAGHNRIAFIGGPGGNILTHQRKEGFIAAIRSAGLNLDQCSFLAGDFTIESGVAAATSLADLHPMPTAVFCANDEMAIGLMSQLSSQGLHVPGDISVIGFDDIAFAKVARPALTTVRQPRGEIGERAMKWLLKLIGGDASDVPDMDILETILVERDSTKVLKEAD